MKRFYLEWLGPNTAQIRDSESKTLVYDVKTDRPWVIKDPDEARQAVMRLNNEHAELLAEQEKE